MAALPLQKGEATTSSEEPGERLQKSLAALIRGSIPNCSAEDFPANPEEGCKRMATFLNLWYPVTSNKVLMERNAFAQACNRLKAAEIRQIVANIHSYRSWLLKKKNNMKTGGRTDPLLMMLIKTVTEKSEPTDSQEVCLAKQPAKAEEEKKDESRASSSKPAKAKRQKTKDPKQEKDKEEMAPGPKPAKAEEGQSPKPVKAGEQSKESPKRAKAVVLDFETPLSKSKSSSVVSVSSADVMSARDMCASEKKPVQAASKKPAAQGKSMKKPAKAECKAKPAKAGGTSAESAGNQQELEKAGEEKKKGEKRPWVSSQSFGFIHETKAKEKAYIRAKLEMADKPYCLVNVNIPGGEKQQEVMEMLFAKAQEPGWTKKALVKEKNELINKA